MKIRHENWLAFKQGCDACRKANGDPKKAENPYPKDSDDSYSWNRGWNSI